MKYETVNPANGESVRAYKTLDDSGLEACLAAAAKSAREWSACELDHRCRILQAVSDQLLERRDELAATITLEMGKLTKEARGEIEKCALVCRYYAEHASEMLADDEVKVDEGKAKVAFQPIGPVLAVMPWNFPFWQVFRFAAPALAAGNVGLLKHASNVPGCALAIADVLHAAGVPTGAFQTLLITNDQTAEVIADERVRAVTLTGSGRAGRAVAGQAGKYLKKAVLELGGSDPFIVLDDADLDKAAEVGVQSRFMNAGQSCIAAKRFIVEKKVAADFIELFKARVEELKPGDPGDDSSSLAPMAREDLRDDLHDQVSASIKKGARRITGCEPVSRAGYFYQPSIIANVKEGQPAFDQELFGPVASVFEVSDEAAAVALANRSRFGLGCSVWTEDRDRGEAVARQVESGSCFVNGLVASDPRVPFGGVKDSGYGRELSVHGIREFVNVKTLWIR